MGWACLGFYWFEFNPNYIIWVGPIPDLMLELSSNDGSGSLDLSLNFTELVLDIWVRKFTFLVLAWVGHVWFLLGLVQLDPDSILVGP